MSNKQRQSERRGFGRRWSCVHGWICVDGRPKVSCIIKNFSEEGALLAVDGPASVPNRFLLEIDAIGFEIGCEVKHVHEAAVGVVFASKTVARADGTAQSVSDLLRSTTIRMGQAAQQAQAQGQ